MSENPQSKVTLEDLLQLKRAERPPAEFWSGFEEALRAKQLAAIVEKRPWWHGLMLPPRAARAVVRWQFPVGASAVLAFSCVAAYQFHSSAIAPSATADVTTPAVAGEGAGTRQTAMMSSVRATTPLVSSSFVASASVMTQPPSPVRTVNGSSVVTSLGNGGNANAALSSQGTPLVAATESGVSGDLMSMIPWAAPQAAPQPPEAPSAETIAAKFASLSASNLSVSVLSPHAHTFESRVVEEPEALPEPEVRPVMVSSPRELRRARILSTLVVADNSTDSEKGRAGHVREILTSGLSDDQLYDSAQRTGMGGDRFTVKF